MALSPTTHLGPYEIVGLVGAGGMGEVYRARDPRLGREVAIKVLPEDVASNPERLRRFEKEARAAGALNHPNILDVHDVGTHEGRPYLVTELLEGDTLRQRLTATPLPVKKAVDYAAQIARGLAAAHEAGIVHRDIKPENLFVTKDGLVKILDFGLAKLRGPQAPAQGMGDAGETASRTTDTGAVIGTAGYMSPEQVRGQKIDHRSDIFSFGAVLYEMLSGRRAFRGDSGVEILNAILNDEPPEIGNTDSDLPPQLERVLRRCLEKKPEDRFQSARDLVFDLEGVRAEPGGGQSGIPSPRATHAMRRPTMSWLSMGLLLGAALGIGSIWAIWNLTRAGPRVVHVRVGLQPAEQLGGALELERHYGLQRPSRTDLALSPDGRRLVFSGGRDGSWQLYLRTLDNPEATPLPGTEGGINPFFSPDGRWIGFWTGPTPLPGDQGELKKVPLSGGLPVTLCRIPIVWGATWGPDDTIVFARQQSGLWRVPAGGGAPEELTTPEDGEFTHLLPHFLPDGEALLFTVLKRPESFRDAKTVLLSIASGERRDLLEPGVDARYVPTGHLVYAHRGNLMAVAFDRARLEVRGEGVPVVEGVMQSISVTTGLLQTGAAQFSVSENGSLVYLEGGAYPGLERSLVWVDREGRVEPLDAPPGNYYGPRLSPDGRQVAVVVDEFSEEYDTRVWVFDLSRGTFRPLTRGGVEWCPTWAPSGQKVAYAAQSGPFGLFQQSPDGSGEVEPLRTSEDWMWPCSWTPDGDELLFREAGDIWVLPISKDERKPRPATRTEFVEIDPVLSPDGRWLAFGSNESGRFEVYVQPFPGPGPRKQVSVHGGHWPAWSGNGRELFFNTQENDVLTMMAVDITEGPALGIGTPRELFEGPYYEAPCRGYDVTPDGQRFLMVDTSEPPPDQPVTHINVVLNWFEELKRRVPTD